MPFYTGQLSEFYGGDVYLRITFWGVGAAGLLSFPMIQGYAGVLLDSHLFLLRTQIVVRAQPQGTHTFHKTHKIGCQQMDDDGLEEKTWFCTGKDQYGNCCTRFVPHEPLSASTDLFIKKESTSIDSWNLVWTTTPSQNKLEEFLQILLSERIMLPPILMLGFVSLKF